MPILATFAAQATLPEIIGVVGFALYVMNYTLLTLCRLSNRDLRYYVLNLSAASCVLIGLSTHFNLAAALIQVFFVTMSLIGIALRLHERGRAMPSSNRRMAA